MKHEDYHRDAGYVMHFRPSNDWQRRHRRLIDAVIHVFFAYDEFDLEKRHRLFSLFFNAFLKCHCPADIEDAVFNVLTGRLTLDAACMKYYYCKDSICRWRRRVILSMTQLLIDSAAVNYHS